MFRSFSCASPSIRPLMPHLRSDTSATGRLRGSRKSNITGTTFAAPEHTRRWMDFILPVPVRATWRSFFEASSADNAKP